MQNSFLVIYSDFTSVANLATGFNPAAFSPWHPIKREIALDTGATDVMEMSLFFYSWVNM
jgi:hypothetical protein